jgi:hypothetical protein
MHLPSPLLVLGASLLLLASLACGVDDGQSACFAEVATIWNSSW